MWHFLHNYLIEKQLIQYQLNTEDTKLPTDTKRIVLSMLKPVKYEPRKNQLSAFVIQVFITNRSDVTVTMVSANDIKLWPTFEECSVKPQHLPDFRTMQVMTLKLPFFCHSNTHMMNHGGL